MDLATLIGLVGAFAFIIMAMVSSGGIAIFIDVPSVLIVMVGSLFVVMMKFNLKQFLGAVKIAAKAFMFKLDKPEELIEQSVTMADAARKGASWRWKRRKFPTVLCKKRSTCWWTATTAMWCVKHWRRIFN